MKIWRNEHTFNDSWETVILAASRKYPNPFNTAVHGIDVIDRKVENGKLRSHRLLTTKWGIPSWATQFLGKIETSYGSEHSEIDPKAKTMRMRTRNLTWGCIVNIDEFLVYKPHPTQKDMTQMVQESVVCVKGVPMSSYLESVVVDNIAKNASKGIVAMEHVAKIINQEALELQMKAKETMESIPKLVFSADNNTQPI